MQETAHTPETVDTEVASIKAAPQKNPSGVTGASGMGDTAVTILPD